MTTLYKTLLACLLCCVLSVAHAEVIDINAADAETIANAITGIGPSRAEAIVAFREANGPFAAVDDLVLVKGIGSTTLDKIRGNLVAK